MLALVHAERLETGEIALEFTSKQHYDRAVKLQEEIEKLVGPVKPVHISVLSEGLRLGGVCHGATTIHVPKSD